MASIFYWKIIFTKLNYIQYNNKHWHYRLIFESCFNKHNNHYYNTKTTSCRLTTDDVRWKGFILRRKLTHKLQFFFLKMAQPSIRYPLKPTISESWMNCYSLAVFFSISSLSAIQRLVSGYDRLVELDHQRCAFVPVSSDLCWEAAVSEDGLHDSCSESCAVQTAVLLGHRDVWVDQWLLFNYVIGLIIVIGLFQFICLLSKQRLPDIDL